MSFFEDVVISDATEIRTTADKVFAYLTGIVDDRTYRAWHPEDHVAFRWLEGLPWAEGSIMRADEFIHGKLHKLTFRITKIVPNQRIEYVPTSRFLRIFYPGNSFLLQQKGEACLFTATGTYRVGRIGRLFFGKAIEKGLSSLRKHMREEGENLKKMLEA